MSGKRQTLTNRTIRRALGAEMVDTVAFTDARVQIALSILRRGFWGRLKWLLTGR